MEAEKKSHGSSGRKRKYFINISILLVVIIGQLIVLEVVCREFYHPKEYKIMWEWLRSNIVASGRNNELYINQNNGLVYNADSKKLDEERYLQFSEPKNITKTKNSGTYRVAILGDSHTCAAGLSDKDDLYIKRLYKLLNKKVQMSGIDNFEILTLCGGGLNTYQELVLLKELAIQRNIDMIVLQYCDNDIFAMKSPVILENSKSYFIDSKTNVILLSDAVVPALPYLSFGANKALLERSAFLRFVSYKLSFMAHNNTNNETLSSFNSIKKMDQIADNNNLPFIVINFVPASPRVDYCSQAVEGNQGKPLHDELRKLTASIAVPFYNMCDYVDNFQEIKSVASPGDDHYNKFGHQLVADILLGAITGQIPEAHFEDGERHNSD